MVGASLLEGAELLASSSLKPTGNFSSWILSSSALTKMYSAERLIDKTYTCTSTRTRAPLSPPPFVAPPIVTIEPPSATQPLVDLQRALHDAKTTQRAHACTCARVCSNFCSMYPTQMLAKRASLWMSAPLGGCIDVLTFHQPRLLLNSARLWNNEIQPARPHCVHAARRRAQGH